MLVPKLDAERENQHKERRDWRWVIFAEPIQRLGITISNLPTTNLHNEERCYATSRRQTTPS